MIVLALLFNFVYATTTPREWIKLPLREDSPFSEIFGKPAEAVIFPRTRQGFLPPVQYIERESKGDEAADQARIRLEILSAMGISAYAKSTLDLSVAPFKAGEGRDLPATLMQIQSAGSESKLTCIGIVKDGSMLRVIYVSAFQASLVDCKTPFVEIARSPVFRN